MRIGLAEVMLTGLLVAVLSIPPTFGWIPRNRFYGFRVPPTLRSDRVWYAINRRFGIQIIVIGLLLAVMAAVFDALGFDTPLGRGVAAAAMMVSLVVTTVRGWRAAVRMEREAGSG